MKCVDMLVGAGDTMSMDVDEIEMQTDAHCDTVQQHCTDELSKQQAGQQYKTPDVITARQQVDLHSYHPHSNVFSSICLSVML